MSTTVAEASALHSEAVEDIEAGKTAATPNPPHPRRKIPRNEAEEDVVGVRGFRVDLLHDHDSARAHVVRSLLRRLQVLRRRLLRRRVARAQRADVSEGRLALGLEGRGVVGFARAELRAVLAG